MTETANAIWVVSDRTADDVYVPTVEIGEDLSVPLGGVRPLMYAAAVYDAASRAEYDAAVLAQLDDLGVELAGAAATVAQLREHREPLNAEATAPLTFTPIVGSEDRRPYVLVAVGDQPIGQWEPADARKHASQVLDIAAAVPLDQTYLKFIQVVLGQTAPVARGAVDNLRRWRL